MTTIKQALIQYYSSGTGGQQWLSGKLATDMCDPDQGWQKNILLKAIAKLCLWYNPQAVHPDMVVEICNSIKMPTVEKLLVLMQGAEDIGFDLSGLFEWMHPVLTKRYFTEVIDFIELKKFIHDTIPGTFRVLFGPAQHEKDLVDVEDEFNIIIPEDKIDYVEGEDPSSRHLYIKDKNDCDDQFRRGKVWLANQFLGNLTRGNIKANFYQDNIFKGGHSFKIIIYRKTDGPLWICFRDNDDKEAGWDYGEEINLPAIKKIVGDFNRMEIIRVVM